LNSSKNMATPDTIAIIEEYKNRNAWAKFTRNSDNERVITGVPYKITVDGQYKLVTVIFNKYLSGPDNEGKFEIIDVDEGGLPSSQEFPIPLSIGVSQLSSNALELLLNPSRLGSIGFSKPDSDKK